MWSTPTGTTEFTGQARLDREEAAPQSVAIQPACSVPGRRSRRGAAIIEFALLAPVLFMLILGMIEFGRVLMVAQLLTDAAREGGRQAVLAGAHAGKVTSTVAGFFTNAGGSG